MQDEMHIARIRSKSDVYTPRSMPIHTIAENSFHKTQKAHDRSNS
jgi:hypothetical protein